MTGSSMTSRQSANAMQGASGGDPRQMMDSLGNGDHSSNGSGAGEGKGSGSLSRPGSAATFRPTFSNDPQQPLSSSHTSPHQTTVSSPSLHMSIPPSSIPSNLTFQQQQQFLHNQSVLHQHHQQPLLQQNNQHANGDSLDTSAYTSSLPMSTSLDTSLLTMPPGNDVSSYNYGGVGGGAGAGAGGGEEFIDMGLAFFDSFIDFEAEKEPAVPI